MNDPFEPNHDIDVSRGIRPEGGKPDVRFANGSADFECRCRSTEADRCLVCPIHIQCENVWASIVSGYIKQSAPFRNCSKIDFCLDETLCHLGRASEHPPARGDDRGVSG